MQEDMFDEKRKAGRNQRELENAQNHLAGTDIDMIPDAMEALHHACKILLEVAIASLPPAGAVKIAHALAPKYRTALCYGMGMGGVYRDTHAHKLFRVTERMAERLADEGLVTVQGSFNYGFYQGFSLTPLGRQVASFILFELDDEDGDE